jgi:hypothetical protein
MELTRVWPFDGGADDARLKLPATRVCISLTILFMVADWLLSSIAAAAASSAVAEFCWVTPSIWVMA